MHSKRHIQKEGINWTNRIGYCANAGFDTPKWVKAPVEKVNRWGAARRGQPFVFAAAFAAGVWLVNTDKRAGLNQIVSADPDLMHGIPCFRGARVPVRVRLDDLKSGSAVSFKRGVSTQSRCGARHPRPPSWFRPDYRTGQGSAVCRGTAIA